VLKQNKKRKCYLSIPSNCYQKNLGGRSRPIKDAKDCILSEFILHGYQPMTRGENFTTSQTFAYFLCYKLLRCEKNNLQRVDLLVGLII